MCEQIVTLDPVISLKALMWVDGRGVLLLQRSEKSKHNPLCWEFPGGKGDIRKDPLLELQREIFEETGLNIKTNHLKIFRTIRCSARASDQQDWKFARQVKITFHWYRCQLFFPRIIKLSFEHCEVCFIGSKKEFEKMVADPNFQMVSEHQQVLGDFFESTRFPFLKRPC